MKRKSRANGFENKFIRQFLEARCMARYGKLVCEVCQGNDCGCKDNKTSENKLINEHIDGDSNNWHPDNMRLASQSCNVKEWHKKKSSGLKVGIDNKRERERGKGKEILLKQAIKDYDLKIESVAMWKATYLKSLVFEHVEKEMMKSPKEGIWLEELANDSANITGLSVNKCREYILSKTFKTGQYSTTVKEGKKFLIWKFRQLEKKYTEFIKKYSK